MPLKCRLMPLKCRLQGLGVGHLCEYPAWKSWVANGEAIALQLWRGGGGAHTHTAIVEHFATCN